MKGGLLKKGGLLNIQYPATQCDSFSDSILSPTI